MTSPRASTVRETTRRMRRMYRRFAPVYDFVTLVVSLWRWRRWQARVLPHARSLALDVGCGTGALLQQLAARGPAVGLDLSLDMLAKARRRRREHGSPADLVCGDIQHLPFRNDAFESVVSTFAINAVPELEEALAEMLRVVRRGGPVAFISVGESQRGGLGTRLAAGLWRREGDIIRDEVAALRELGVEARREDFGPFGTVHLITVAKP